MSRVRGPQMAAPSDAAALAASLDRQRERFANIVAIGRAIGSSLDLDKVLQVVVENTSLAVQAERTTLFLVDQERSEIWSKVAQGKGLTEIRLPLGSGIAGWVCTHGQPVLLNDARQDPRWNRVVDRSTGYSTRSMIVAPLRDMTGGILGAIQALNRVEGDFEQDDLALLEAISAQAGVAIENARLFRDEVARNAELTKAKEELAASLAELDLLFDVERRISGAPTLDEVIHSILEKVTSALEVEAALILNAREETGSLFAHRAHARADHVKKVRIARGEGIPGKVATTGDPILTNDAATHPAYSVKLAKLVAIHAKAMLCVPLPGENGAWGALALVNPVRGRNFQDHDLRLATLVAGQVSRAIALARDRDEGERKARLAAIGQMMSGILHDLRTPMTIIGGYAELLVDEANPVLRRQNAEIILKQLDHIGGMAKDTLAFARGETDILLRKVYLDAFVTEIAEYVAKEFAGKGIELKVHAGYKGTARMDEGKMKRALFNVARNAAQAMPHGGRFTLSVDKEDDKLVFRLADTGPGIPPEIADKLFQSFVTAGKKAGTGLGLAIVKTVVEQHGGDVSCKTRAGKGTTFTLRIPL